MKLVIGFLGENGAGKTTALDLLKNLFCADNYSFTEYKSSDILMETLAIWVIEKTRTNLQCLAYAMDSAFGAGTLSHAMRIRIINAQTDIVCFDGVRWESDKTLIRSLHGILIYITAPAEIRFERLKKRNQKVGEGVMTWEQFLEEEKAPTEAMIPHIGKTADFLIQNDITPEEFERKLAAIYRTITASL